RAGSVRQDQRVARGRRRSMEEPAHSRSSGRRVLEWLRAGLARHVSSLTASPRNRLRAPALPAQSGFGGGSEGAIAAPFASPAPALPAQSGFGGGSEGAVEAPFDARAPTDDATGGRVED